MSDLYHAGAANVDNAVIVTADQAKLLDCKSDIIIWPIKNKKQLRITGGDLIKRGVLKPSPQLGKVLDYLEHSVVAGKILNQPENLVNAAINFLNEDW